ncbi:MAG TPA: MBOAT family O-acyltransferase [Bacteroidales bacterium]|nr:MBOAT family O-acyltransferase [Bacteroidales bacterium]
MVYSSAVFLFYFLPLLLAGYHLLPKTWFRNIFLFLASMLFYAWAEGTMLILLLGIAFSAWLFSYLIAKTRFSRLFVYLAVILYVAVLFYYKYLGFFINDVFNLDGDGLSHFKLMMPVGVSFFVFQAISYVIDVHRRRDCYEKNPFHVILYITMFPQLISGPLVRYQQLGPQLKLRTYSFDMFAVGIRRFMAGLAKKVLIADTLGLLVRQIMDTETQFLGASAAWIGIIAFTLQLYYDFAGYTDMAIGVGKMLGFDLPENFNFPYISRSIAEFWRRWHMTLSAWLRDYVFMPLSLNTRRRGRAGVFFSLMITFTLCGIWHSPGWNFLIWGAIHGLFLGLEQLFLGKYLVKLKAAAFIYTLFILITSFVFVRTRDVHHALEYLGTMFSPGEYTALGPEAFLAPQYIVIMIIGIIFCFPLKLPPRLTNGSLAGALQTVKIILLLVLFLLSAMAVTTETYNPFLYFKY